MPASWLPNRRISLWVSIRQFCAGVETDDIRDTVRYGPDDILPPRCPTGQYCPDEGSYCRPMVSLGGACQLDRDGALERYSLYVHAFLTCVYVQINANHPFRLQPTRRQWRQDINI